MSTEPKYPKRRFNARYGREMEAPDGYYLLPAGGRLSAGDMSFSVSFGWRGAYSMDIAYGKVPPDYAWTYARRLPQGQPNDDDMPAPAQRSGKWAWSTDEENFQGKWAWSTDEENFQGACDSAEAAFVEGADQSDIEDDQTLYVGQIAEPDPVPGITADRVLEWVEEYLGDEAPDSIDEILPRPSAAQKAVLEEALRRTYEAWLAAYPDQKPQWFRIKGKVLEKTGAEIRELSAPET